MEKVDLGSKILAVGGLLAALIGSISIEGPVWASRLMLLTNAAVLVLGWWSKRKAIREPV